MLQIHPNARTTPITRAEIAHSCERTGVLAQRYGVSTETIRKWRKRGAADCLDHSARPYHLPWKATEAERAIVCTLRRVTNFALDDLTFVITHFLPHLNRDSIWRILKVEGLNRRPKPASPQPAKGQGTFKDYDLGFVHIDIKHLPKLQTSVGRNGCRRVGRQPPRRAQVQAAQRGHRSPLIWFALVRDGPTSRFIAPVDAFCLDFRWRQGPSRN
jgi:transposase